MDQGKKKGSFNLRNQTEILNKNKTNIAEGQGVTILE